MCTMLLNIIKLNLPFIGYLKLKNPNKNICYILSRQLAIIQNLFKIVRGIIYSIMKTIKGNIH